MSVLLILEVNDSQTAIRTVKSSQPYDINYVIEAWKKVYALQYHSWRVYYELPSKGEQIDLTPGVGIKFLTNSGKLHKGNLQRRWNKSR